MTKEKPKKVVNALQIYSRLFVYVKQYWLALVVAGVASMLYSGVDAWFIYFLKPLLNKGLMEKNHVFLKNAPWLVLGVFLLRGIASFFSNFSIASASRGVIMNMRQDLFAKLQLLPASYYDRATTGKILSVLLYAVEQVSNASADVLTTAIQAIFLIIGLVLVMISISLKLTLLYFLTIPFVTIVMRIASLRIRRLSLSIQDSIAEISERAEENIEGYKVIRSFEGQEYELTKFNKAARTNRQREMKVIVARALSLSSVQFITACALSMTLYISTLDQGSSLLTPGGFVAMVAAMLALLKPMKDMALVQNKLYKGLAGAQNVFELMDEETEIDKGKNSLTRAKGKIQFKQVHFHYDDNRKVLHDISFDIEPGEIVAFVGKSGSGKSTLISLLSRFYHNYIGQILIDDVSITDYQLKDLRRQFAVVSQNVTLFHDTVFNNIAYGRFDDVSEANVLRAAKASHSMEFIEKLPHGLHSLIGENGVLLSGGQRQRIAIARAILKNAPILILDEATSSLDTESERYIQNALEELMKNRTTLVIAHRLSTIEHANRIIVMDDGKILEIGNHDQLLKQNGYYAKLYHLQFGEMLSLPLGSGTLVHEA